MLTPRYRSISKLVWFYYTNEGNFWSLFQIYSLNSIFYAIQININNGIYLTFRNKINQELKLGLKVAHFRIAVTMNFEIEQPGGVGVRSVQMDMKKMDFFGNFLA